MDVIEDIKPSLIIFRMNSEHKAHIVISGRDIDWFKTFCKLTP